MGGPAPRLTVRTVALAVLLLMAGAAPASAQSVLDELFQVAPGGLVSDGRYVVTPAGGIGTIPRYDVLDAATGARRTIRTPAGCPAVSMSAGELLLSCAGSGRRAERAFVLAVRTGRRRSLPPVRVRGHRTRYVQLGRRWALVDKGGFAPVLVRRGRSTPLRRHGAGYGEGIDLDARDPRPALCAPVRRPRRPIYATSPIRPTGRFRPGEVVQGRRFVAWTADDAQQVVVHRCGARRPRVVETCGLCLGLVARGDVLAFSEGRLTGPRSADLVHALHVPTGRRGLWRVPRVVAHGPALAAGSVFVVNNSEQQDFRLLRGTAPG